MHHHLHPVLSTLISRDETTDSKKTGISERKLKKMALGLPGYKDVQRDYNDTLEELGSFNHANSQEWTEGIGPKMERLTDGPSVKKSNSEMQQSIDPRALAIRNANKPQMGPNGRPRPPPLRSRLGPPRSRDKYRIVSKLPVQQQGRRRGQPRVKLLKHRRYWRSPLDQKRVLQ